MRSFLYALLFSLPLFALGQPRRIVIAHRGDHTQAPENTLKAYEDAITYEFDYVEVDLRTTKDGKLVIMHDATVDRMTNGTGNVKELTLEELSKLEVSDKERPTLGKFKIPQFEEVLDLCKGKIGIYLDFKDADPKIVWDLIHKRKMDRAVVIYINEEEQFKKWRSTAPYMPLMVSLPDSINSVDGLKQFLKKVDPEILDGGLENYSPEMVDYAIRKKKEVWLDFQQPNEGQLLWSRGAALGIQGFQTDKPRELKKWLSKLPD